MFEGPCFSLTAKMISPTAKKVVDNAATDHNGTEDAKMERNIFKIGTKQKMQHKITLLSLRIITLTAYSKTILFL